jgi:hypothetical protein
VIDLLAWIGHPYPQFGYQVFHPRHPPQRASGETKTGLPFFVAGQQWRQCGSAPKRIQRDMLKVIFEAVYVDVLGRRLVCVKPYPQFTPLFRMDGLSEKEGYFYVEREED